jgi:hypothetical protein
MIRYHCTIFVLAIWWSSACFGQHQLLMMNGKELELVSFIDTSRLEISFVYDKNWRKNHRIRQYNLQQADLAATKLKRDASFTQSSYDKYLNNKIKNEKPAVLKSGVALKDEVFSILTSEGEERIYYFQDAFLGNDFTIEEMRTFIAGETDARKNYKAKGAFWGGVGVGLVSGYLLETSVVAFAVPVAYTLAMRIPVVHIRDRHMSDTKYKGNQIYLEGFESTARNRLMIQGLKGSAIGLVSGLVLFAVLNPDQVQYFR